MPDLFAPLHPQLLLCTLAWVVVQLGLVLAQEGCPALCFLVQDGQLDLNSPFLPSFWSVHCGYFLKEKSLFCRDLKKCRAKLDLLLYKKMLLFAVQNQSLFVRWNCFSLETTYRLYSLYEC